MIDVKDVEAAPGPLRHRRIFVAAMSSVVINLALLVGTIVAASAPGSLVARIVNAMTLPSALVVGRIFAHGGHTISSSCCRGLRSFCAVPHFTRP